MLPPSCDDNGRPDWLVIFYKSIFAIALSTAIAKTFVADRLYTEVNPALRAPVQKHYNIEMQIPTYEDTTNSSMPLFFSPPSSSTDQ